MSSRREFIERLSATAMLGTLPLSHVIGEPLAEVPPTQGQGRAWDMSWTARLAGRKHRACFDCVEVEDGNGVFRSSMWEAQYESALGVPRGDIITVLILRHNATVLALKHDMWARYEIGKGKAVRDPVTGQDATRNPVLLTVDEGLPQRFAAMALAPFMARGGVVLACGAALSNWSAAIAAKDGVSRQEAYERARAGLLPGIHEQPSGVFAAVKAQEEGCVYVRAS